MPRAPWRRRSNDSPRPAGRRWTGRLRRSGSLARQAPFLMIRVVRRRGGQPRQPYSTRRTLLRRTRRVDAISPVSPAPTGASSADPGVLDATRRALDEAAARSLEESARRTVEEAAARRRASATDDATVPHTIRLIPGEVTSARRAKFAFANSFTLISLMLGMSAIFLSMHHDIRWAAVALLGCVASDGLDGAVARKLGVASPFGAQMDSLADMCSFGIAAPVVVYASLHGSAPSALVAAACIMIAVGAMIRLARFNVSPKDGRYFVGVPTTLIAGVMGMAVLIGLQMPGIVAVVAVAVLAVSMVSGFPYAKLGRLIALPRWFWVVPLVGLFMDYRITFAVLVAAYVVSGPLLWLRQRGHRDALTA
ncbi:MAG TPA: CDP-alcohol phosphatidyltransferase family protein [Micromonosporaceae bacterium]|nr:CDP-alcohol phosphatidyltransferase family protein [Micromonosporaceae bacterium]